MAIFNSKLLNYQRVIIFLSINGVAIFEYEWGYPDWRIPSLPKTIESWKVFQKVWNRWQGENPRRIPDEPWLGKWWSTMKFGVPGVPYFRTNSHWSWIEDVSVSRLPPIQRMFVWSVSEVPPTMSPHNVMLTGQWPFHHFLVWSFCSGRFFQLTQSSDFTRISYFETGNTPVVIDEIPIMSELHPHKSHQHFKLDTLWYWKIKAKHFGSPLNILELETQCNPGPAQSPTKPPA